MAHMEVQCKIGSRKICPLRIKCTRQRPGHVNEKRRLDGVTSIIATNRKWEGTSDGTGTEVITCLTNKWRAKINQEGLYNVKISAPRGGGAGKNGQKPEPPSPPPGERLPRRTRFKPCMNTTKNPPSGDWGLTFQTHALQMILFRPFYEQTQHCYGSLWIVSSHQV